MGFADDLQKFSDKTKLRLDLVVRKTVLDIYTGTVLRTPVDTGRLRANYQIGDGVRPGASLLAEFEQRAEAERGAHGEKAVVAARKANKAVQEGTAQALEVVSTLHAGGRVYIVNNLVYALPIENGHSQQAPAGMARVTVRAVAASMGDLVREVRTVDL